MVKMIPEPAEYVTYYGIVYCCVLKALYGCVRAIKLWYNKLMKMIQPEGYEHSPTDPCVMRRIVDEKNTFTCDVC